MVATFLSRWSSRPARQFDGWSASAVLVCCLILGPIAALVMMAFGDSGGLWSHLVSTVLPRYVTNTLLLMAGVGVLAMHLLQVLLMDTSKQLVRMVLRTMTFK